MFLLAVILPAQQPAPPVASRPKLVVVVVVDQMRADYIERMRTRWHAGLRRLVDQGAWLTKASYPYSVTETCPGHATISTGVFPAQHGIVGNTWLDSNRAKTVTCTQDPSVRNIGASTDAPGDSAASLAVPSLSEQIRSSVPGSRTVTMSLKARSAAMLAGHRADAVTWIDDATGAIVTSTAYGESIPAFAHEFEAAHPASADFLKIWELSAPRQSYRGGSSVAGVGPPAGWTTTFPHSLAANDSAPGATFVNRWRASPFANVWLGELADAAIKKMQLGHGPGIDYLGVAFSATDYVGHAFGPDSLEQEDTLLRLDETIGTLLDTLDQSVGRGQYVVALSADHGVAPVPEQARARGLDANRLSSATIVTRAESAMTQQLGPGKHVAAFIAPELYFASGATAQLDAKPGAWRAVEQALLSESGVANVVRRTQAAQSAAKPPLPNILASEFFPSRNGDLWISLKPNWIISGATGTTHGSANAYDQNVPIILFGQSIKSGRYDFPATPADIAPTLAALTGVKIATTQGHVLQQALAQRRSAAAR